VRFDKICVLGLGYIGLPTASTFAKNGINVVGVDVNPHIISSLQNGQVHIYEPGLRALVQDSFQSGKLKVKNQPEEADAFIIAVPTPFLEDKRADMRFVISAAEAILPHLRKGNLVVLESTSPPLTTKNIVAPILEKSGLIAGEDFYLAYTPERVLPGHIIRELVENARVIGGLTSESAQAGKDLYSVFVKGEIILTDATTAEMVKLMENTYRDVNIAIANEFSRLSDRFNIDVWEAISIANLHPRVKILNPGPGVGGHCISVDPWFLVEAAPDLTPLIKTAREVNDTQPHFLTTLVGRLLGGSVSGRNIAVLGLSYKADVDDMRESPAIEAAHLLKEQGANIKCFDPFYKSEMGLLDINPCDDLKSVLTEAEVLVLVVNHTAFKELKPEEIAAATGARLILDVSRVLNAGVWKAAGFKVYTLGNGRDWLS
jgi:UDP-N-acetyl-D-mannosaminuronic acid dehydrogenase